MKPTEQTIQQVERAIRKIAQKFPADREADIMTDIHLRVTQESGEMVAYDDDDKEVNRCVIEQWIDNKDEDFYKSVTDILRTVLTRLHDTADNLSILKPYSFVLEDEDKEHIEELYVVDDDDTIIIDGELMEGLDKDLDDFFNDLMK